MLAGDTVFIHAAELDRFRYPPNCPFDAGRAGRTRSMLLSMGLLSGPGLRQETPRPASREELLRMHEAAYLDEMERAARGDLTAEGFRMGLGTPDCPVFPDMWDCAAWACGATLTGARLVRDGRARAAFNASGGFHHAHPAAAAGFCYVNDVALACAILAEGGRRVAYLDVDVHHSDGVQEAFYARNDVLTVSLHESGHTLFPGGGFEAETGEGAGIGFNVNVPLPAGTFDEPYLRAFRELAMPLIRAYDPDAIVLELGMDALAGDPLAHLSLTNNAHAEVVASVLALEKPIVMTGGGGYNVGNTVRGWALAWTVLAGLEEEHDPSVGLGGVMLGSAEWAGGLRDRVLPGPVGEERRTIERAVDATIEKVKAQVFPVHGL